LIATHSMSALALVRGGVNDSTAFFNFIAGEIASGALVLLLGFGLLLISNEITLLNQYAFQAPFNL